MDELIERGAVLGKIKESNIDVVLGTGLECLLLRPLEDAARELSNRGQLYRLADGFKACLWPIDEGRTAILPTLGPVGHADGIGAERAIYSQPVTVRYATISEDRRSRDVAGRAVGVEAMEH